MCLSWTSPINTLACISWKQGHFPSSLNFKTMITLSNLILIFFSFIFISWRLITLQYCSGFCHTLTWISHGFTCVPHPDPPSCLPLHPISLGLPSVPALSTCWHQLMSSSYLDFPIGAPKCFLSVLNLFWISSWLMCHTVWFCLSVTWKWEQATCFLYLILLLFFSWLFSLEDIF